MPLSEFEIIRRYFNSERLDFPRAGVDLGPGDDGALLSVPEDHQLVVTLDVSNEGVHFPPDSLPGLIAWRGLAVNLSDLAAMGAEPWCFSLGLSLPRAELPWLEDFARGLADCAGQYQCPLTGGDLTRGPLSLAIQAHGLVPRGRALLRSGARTGDQIFVTGTLGDAAAGLRLVQRLTGALEEGTELGLAWHQLTPAGRDRLVEALFRPRPRLAAGRALCGLASAAIDVSDGLVADLGHIARASGLGARIRLPSLPLSETLRACASSEQALRLAAAGGDDYELCFTAPAERSAEVEKRLADLAVPVTCIGEMTDPLPDDFPESADPVECLDSHGKPVTFAQRGFEHFPGPDSGEPPDPQTPGQS